MSLIKLIRKKQRNYHLKYLKQIARRTGEEENAVKDKEKVRDDDTPRWANRITPKIVTGVSHMQRYDGPRYRVTCKEM